MLQRATESTYSVDIAYSHMHLVNAHVKELEISTKLLYQASNELRRALRHRDINASLVLSYHNIRQNVLTPHMCGRSWPNRLFIVARTTSYASSATLECFLLRFAGMHGAQPSEVGVI